MVDADLSSSAGKAARNERRKAVATTCNALAVAVFISAFLQPLIAGRPNVVGMVGASVGFIAFQLALHYILRQVEDWMDPLIQSTLIALLFGAFALVVFWLSMRSDRRR